LVGKTLGQYEIVGALGTGGMGEVYRGRDTTLERDVAIKVLPEDLARDAERLARLEREAKILASLNHPNIATIYNLEEDQGTRFLVLELIKGESLEQLLTRGPLPVEKALELCKQIAEALEAAHGEGIIHRDLKPANVLVTPEGRAKVLDFGIAKSMAVDVDVAETSNATNLTVTGVLVGTPSYMSPEQIRGEPIDKRVDIWAFGCLLYETLTATNPFARETLADTLAAIVDQEPDVGALAGKAPARIGDLIDRCLSKDPRRRLRDIGDAWVEIEEATGTTSPRSLAGAAAAEAGTVDRGVRRVATPWVAAALVVGALLGAAVLRYAAPQTPRPVVRLSVDVEAEPGMYLWGGAFFEFTRTGIRRPSRTAMALSPNGSYLVYSATDASYTLRPYSAARRLYLRQMDRDRAIAVPGIERGHGPFFSPDGVWIGYTDADGLKKVPTAGGEPLMITSELAATNVDSVDGTFGASWGDDGTIVTARQSGGLVRVADTGGSPQPLTALDLERGETSHRLPFVLPGSDAVLFTVLRGLDEGLTEIAVQPMDGTGERKTLITEGSDPRYVSTGHLLFARRGTLMAVGFDLDRLETVGDPVMVIDDVMHSVSHGQDYINTFAAQVAVSATGMLVYARGGIYPKGQREVALVDRSGEARTLPIPPGVTSTVRRSPDGTRLAYVTGRGNDLDVWTYDMDRDIPTPLTTQGLTNREPVWSPDGTSIAFASNRDGSAFNIYRMAAAGSGTPQRLTVSSRDQHPSSWSSEGVIAFLQDRDIWVLPPGGEPRPLFESEAMEMEAEFSPDGKWLAYVSNKTGSKEIYVRPYPSGAETPITRTDGADEPVWSADGKEITFRVRNSRFMAVEVMAGDDFDFGVPEELFVLSGYMICGPARCHDVDLDGNFLLLSDSPPLYEPVKRLDVILNWFEELKERVPTGR